ncbi:MAG: Rpp14/Pop5 family protein [Nanoarchaeota archaeon]
MKLKPILPSLKEKKRYLSFEIISDNSIPVNETEKAIYDSVLNFLGTFEAGKASLMFLNDKYSNNNGVIKTNHKYTDKVRTALALIKTIDSKEVIVRTRVVSGTLKKAISKYLIIKKQEVEI